MKRTYFREYITELEKIYDSSKSELEAMLKDYHSKEVARDKARNNHNIAPERRQIIELECKEASNKTRASIVNLKKTTADKVKALRSELLEDCKKHLAIKPEQTTIETITLISSGLMNVNDYMELCNTSWNNPTVLRLVANKCENSEDTEHRTIAMHLKNYLSPESRTSVFDSADYILEKTINENLNLTEKHLATFNNMYDERRDALINTMNLYDGFKGLNYV